MAISTGLAGSFRRHSLLIAFDLDAGIHTSRNLVVDSPLHIVCNPLYTLLALVFVY